LAYKYDIGSSKFGLLVEGLAGSRPLLDSRPYRFIFKVCTAPAFLLHSFLPSFPHSPPSLRPYGLRYVAVLLVGEVFSCKCTNHRALEHHWWVTALKWTGWDCKVEVEPSLSSPSPPFCLPHLPSSLLPFAPSLPPSLRPSALMSLRRSIFPPWLLAFLLPSVHHSLSPPSLPLSLALSPFFRPSSSPSLRPSPFPSLPASLRPFLTPYVPHNQCTASRTGLAVQV
jgi:hypothetical protein